MVFIVFNLGILQDEKTYKIPLYRDFPWRGTLGPGYIQLSAENDMDGLNGEPFEKWVPSLKRT